MNADSSKEQEKQGLKQWWLKSREALHVVSGTPRIFMLVWKAHKGYAAAALFLNFLLALVPLAQIELTKLILDSLAAGAASPASHVLLYVLGFAGVSLLSNCLEPSSTVVEETLADLLTRDVNILILNKAGSFADISMFENPTFYNKLSKVQDGASYKPLQAFHTIKNMVRGVVGLLSMLIVLLAFQPMLVLALVLLSFPHLVVQFMHRKEQWSIQDYEIPEVRKMHYYRSMATNDYVAKELRIFGLQNFFLDRYLSSFGSFFQRHDRLRKRHWLNNLLLATLSATGTAGSYAYVAMKAIAGEVSIGSLSLYFGAISQVINEMALLVWSTSSIYESNLYMNDVFQFLGMPSTMALVPAEQARLVPAPIRQGIEFRNVRFSYPSKEKTVLEDISFTVRPGQTVALVGENGAGKTTIVKLLSRLYDPTGGSIFVDGVDLREFDLERWRANVSVIFQDYCHFHIPARENIGLGQLAALDDMSAIKRAAQRSGAAEMVDELPKGYDTILGYYFPLDQGEGSELSGGQWQKIALARAFMRSLGQTNESEERVKENGSNGHHTYTDAQLLILDEPTAALDAKAEYDVYTRFSELTKGKSTILISHRFSTVRMADLIIVIENGKVLEQGNHDELMAREGEYAKLYKLQADRYK